MVQDAKKKNEIAEANKRLQEIALIKFGEITDDEILELLAERKRLIEIKNEYERLKKEEEEKLQKEQERLKKEEEERLRKEKEKEELLRKEQEKLKKEEEEKRLALEKEQAEKIATMKKKKQTLVKEIEKISQSISPEKADDELLFLIAERKKLETELKNIETQLSGEPESSIEIPRVESSEILEAEIPPDNFDEKKEIIFETEEKKEAESKAEPAKSFKESLKEEFGQEGIEEDLPENGELRRYLTQLQNNTGALGTLLQEMPADAKKNKAFMLQVAKIDPAYAMHYADKELKKNESFNIRVASMKNPRNSGNALAEMLPEARISRVVLAAVKQDYRNIKFIQPNMEDYDEMMQIAKKAAMEKLKSLKSAADMTLIIPRPLQQDRQFMAEVKMIAEKEK
jgi:hypothetical protein